MLLEAVFRDEIGFIYPHYVETSLSQRFLFVFIFFLPLLSNIAD